MNRRDLLKLITAATGTALIGGNTLLAGCATQDNNKLLSFTNNDVLLLDEVAEVILPRTDTPGAKDAELGAFMRVFVTDCYTTEEQTVFHAGLVQLRERCQRELGEDFFALSGEQRQQMVQALDTEAKAQVAAGGTHYFTMIKQLTLFGFFTSEVGGTQVLRHIAIPGRFDGCMPYQEGDGAWATR